jgi:hypothetical protein
MPFPASHAFASENPAGICPGAGSGLADANADAAPSWGDDRWPWQACALFQDLFETERNG